MARKRIDLDLAQVEKLAALQVTQGELAAWFGVSEATVHNRLKEPAYAEAWERGRGKGRVSLRRSQFALASKNAAMGIWLGKQWLGQKDGDADEGAAAKAAIIDLCERLRAGEAKP